MPFYDYDAWLWWWWCWHFWWFLKQLWQWVYKGTAFPFSLTKIVVSNFNCDCDSTKELHFCSHWLTEIVVSRTLPSSSSTKIVVSRSFSNFFQKFLPTSSLAEVGPAWETINCLKTKHCKRGKLFCLLIFLSRFLLIKYLKCVKSQKSLFVSKVAVNYWPTDQG